MRLVILLLLSALPTSAAELLQEPGPEILPGKNADAWQPLFAALSAKGAVEAGFVERRWFKLRQEPVVISGRMRLAPERGLSLHYTDSDRTVIIDEQGVLLRDARGRQRTIRPDPRAPAVETWLLPILRFDLSALEATFRLHGARSGDAWRLDFVPRSPADAEPEDVGTLVVHGDGEVISRIELHPKPDLRAEIEIGETRTGVTFPPEEQDRFFR